MKKIIVYFLLLVSNQIFSQAKKDSLLAKNINTVIEELRFVYGLDQNTRKYLDYGTFNKSFIDSIEQLKKEEIINVVDFSKLSQETRDIIWKNYLTPLDSLKAERIIEIIETYGYPSVNRLESLSGKDIDFNPLIIIVHTPFAFKDRMIPLIEREYNLGNINNKCEYGYLLWHLNGRTDFKYMLENGYKMETNANGTFHLINTCE